MERFNTIAVASLFFAITVMSGGVAGAAPVLWPVEAGGNGHYYEEFQLFMSWDAARTFAGSQSHLGVPGHLVTITTEEERDFLLSANLPDAVLDAGAFLGAYQDLSDPAYSEPGGGWKWVTGESWGYESWDPGAPQPDNFGGGQNYGSLHPSGVWDDIPGSMQRTVLVEYSLIPEPSTALLMGLGLAGLAVRRGE